jgi:hypothetical protein
VVVVRKDSGFAGTFALVGPAGRALRTIEAPTCAQLTDAMSLVAALAVDPEASLASGEPPASTLDAAEVPAAPSPSPGRVPAPPVPPPPAPSTPAQLPPPPAASEPASPPLAVSTRNRFELGAAIELMTAIAPEVVTGFGLRADYEPRSSPASWLAPSFGAELAGAASNVFQPAPALVVSLVTVRLDACPLRVPLGAALSLRACGAVGLALLVARGVGAPTAETAVRPWVDAEGWLRVRWEDRRWFVGLDGGPLVPITRPTFVFLNPHTVVYEVRAAGVLTALSAGMRF